MGDGAVSCRYDGYIMMSRTQITLDPELLRRARARASEMGISLAEYVRRAVAANLEAPPQPVGVSAVFDLGRSTGSDVARHRDRYVADAVADGWERER
jgi:hypothetical protein